MMLIVPLDMLIEFDGFADEMYRLIRDIVADKVPESAASRGKLVELTSQMAKYHSNCWMHEKIPQIYGHSRYDRIASDLDKLAARLREQPGLVGASVSTRYAVDFAADLDAFADSGNLVVSPAALTGLVGHFLGLVVLWKHIHTAEGKESVKLAPHADILAFVAARPDAVDKPRTDVCRLARLAGRCFEYAHAHPAGEAAEIGEFVDSQAKPLLRPILEQACAIAPQVCPPLNKLFE